MTKGWIFIVPLLVIPIFEQKRKAAEKNCKNFIYNFLDPLEKKIVVQTKREQREKLSQPKKFLEDSFLPTKFVSVKYETLSG